MRRYWPVLLLLLPAAVALPFLPLRRIAWRVTSEERADSYSRSMVWLMNRQQTDGSWDEGPASLEGHPIQRPGSTGLALLTFLGHGYTHLSKDVYEWYDVGHCVRTALQWLMRDQLPDGTFRSSEGTLDHLLATMALSEAYGLTGSTLFKDQAQAAMNALVDKMRAGELGDDADLHAWAASALASGEASRLRMDSAAKDRIRAFYDARPVDRPGDAGEVLARIVLQKDTSHPRLAPAVARIAARTPRVEQQDFSSWYWGSFAVFQYDGPSGANWKAWSDPLKATLENSRSSRGDWPGRNRGETYVRTCQATLTLMVYYRNTGCVLGTSP